MNSVIRGRADFTATAPSGSGLAVQCRRSLPSSRRGQRWLLQGHCTELINGPSYVAAVCLMSLITTDHTSRPATHTHTHTLGIIRPVCFLSSHPPAILPQIETGTAVCGLHLSSPSTHLYSVFTRTVLRMDTRLHAQKEREREVKWSVDSCFGSF